MRYDSPLHLLVPCIPPRHPPPPPPMPLKCPCRARSHMTLFNVNWVINHHHQHAAWQRTKLLLILFQLRLILFQLRLILFQLRLILFQLRLILFQLRG